MIGQPRTMSGMDVNVFSRMSAVIWRKRNERQWKSVSVRCETWLETVGRNLVRVFARYVDCNCAAE